MRHTSNDKRHEHIIVVASCGLNKKPRKHVLFSASKQDGTRERPLNWLMTCRNGRATVSQRTWESTHTNVTCGRKMTKLQRTSTGRVPTTSP
jgi:hypothetical protein